MAFPREPGMSDADFEVVKAMVATSFGSIRTVNEYDAGGRLATRARQFGQLGEERTVYRYDTAGRPLEESMVRVDRMMSLEKDGSPRLHSDTTRRHETRFTYVDDRHGNWTERTVSWRIEEGAAFVVSNVERRTIEYYDEAS
jgi:hypothetical protein